MAVDLSPWLDSGESTFAVPFLVVTDLRRPRHERITKEEVQAVIESYRRMNWWP
jgi:hypothetical protein